MNQIFELANMQHTKLYQILLDSAIFTLNLSFMVSIISVKMKDRVLRFISCWIWKRHNLHLILESLVDSIVYDITPEETEDEGAGGKEVKNGDLDLPNSEGEAEHFQTKNSH